MSADEIRAAAVEAVARAQRAVDLAAYPQREDGTPREDWAAMPDWARDMYLTDVAPLVDALAEAGLLPTGVEWVARNTAGGGIVRSHRRAAESDRDHMRLVPRPSVWDDEVPAEEFSRIERRYVTDWQEVTE
ncbi:hypothetical protein [Nocardia cyriacigeorgica]|uniref:Uncharacterized protein n=1 Tax=Nocardia cyriacigeorgica TaxID=135487 RepID=A0A5R8NED7_9NOCA|nr:hypothetical protein [Nocardia cyriacigeorgica]TLF72897.1 hypothetical protein FEK34_28145 [Nocardia cyriacigeorgica]